MKDAQFSSGIQEQEPEFFPPKETLYCCEDL
jgi:hypothetical protein